MECEGQDMMGVGWGKRLGGGGRLDGNGMGHEAGWSERGLEAGWGLQGAGDWMG